jgi:hypothetical protein
MHAAVHAVGASGIQASHGGHRCAGHPPRQRRPGPPRRAHVCAGADADAKGQDEGEGTELTGRRFGAPRLAATLVDRLATEAAAAASADLQLPPNRPALRTLLRTPLLAALGAKAMTNASTRLAARKKPTGLAWRFKRWIASELLWQARAMRHAVRVLRRCCGGCRNPVGKAFRAVPSSAHSSSGAVLVEVTWRFGWFGRNSAACWRHRLRDGAQLAALEAALAAAFATSAVEVIIKEAGGDQCHDAADVRDAVVVALLDDESHVSTCVDRV